MREVATVPGYRLSRARLSTRVLTSLGLVGLLLGLAGAVLLTVSRTGLSPASVRAYYLGEEEAAPIAGSLEHLMAEAPHARPFGELAEVTHLHLMGGSLLLFLLCHLLSVCDVSERFRITLYTVAFVSFISTFGLPWAIVYGSPVFAAGFGPSIVIFLLSLFVLAAAPLREMWFRE